MVLVYFKPGALRNHLENGLGFGVIQAFAPALGSIFSFTEYSAAVPAVEVAWLYAVGRDNSARSLAQVMDMNVPSREVLVCPSCQLDESFIADVTGRVTVEP